MTILNIPEYCSVDEVLSWDIASTEGFRVTRASSFEPGAQGVAISRLAGLKGKDLKLRCEFKEPTASEEFEASLLGTPFGVSLIRHTKSIAFNQGKEQASAGLEANLTLYYKEREGVLGRGQSSALVCVDPAFSIPPKLIPRETPRLRTLSAKPSEFLSLLKSMTALLGFQSFLASFTERPLQSFLYECFINSQEHGISNTSYIGRHSVRALMVDKVVIDKGNVSRRLSDDLRGYIARSSEAAGNRLGLGMVCLTVADQGDGIQTTLPKSHASETEEERFARAFLPGESRKPRGAIKRGLGLDRVLFAAHQMRARIAIQSGALRYLQDFSFEEQKYPQVDTGAIQRLAQVGTCGTSVSVWVPEYEHGLDQVELFGSTRQPEAS